MMLSDFHCHILPQIDDGSASMEESIAMLRQESRQGIPRVVMTPHFYAHHDAIDRFLKRREDAYLRLIREMVWCVGMPEAVLGAEVHYFGGISRTEAIQDLVIEGTKCVLIEMPQSTWTEEMYRELADISDKQGLQPVIAHIDRYISPYRRNEHLRKLEQLPMLMQANSSFFLRPKTSRMALRMLENNQIHLLGSDCHNLTSRPPNLGEAAELIRTKLGGIKIREIRAHEKRCFGEKSPEPM